MDEPTEKIVGCSAVNNHLSKPIPSTLWHYTSYAGFQGIVTSKKIWATEYRFLNDREEFLHAKALAQRVLEEEPEYVADQFPAREYVRKAVELVFNTGHLHEDRLHVMVASFSEEGDQLSQWRGYANDSRGVSVGFDLRNIRPPSDLGTAVTFAPCLYKQDDKRALLKEVFAHYRQGLVGWWTKVADAARSRLHENFTPGPDFGQKIAAEHYDELKATLNHYYATLQFDLLRAAPLLKNETFSEENEWRLVLPLGSDKEVPSVVPLEFRYTRDTLVPYIAHPLYNPGEQGPIRINDVILGPGSHTSAEVGVNLFLQKEKIQALARRSQIPYRPT